jgi:hypothetical protein
VSAWLRIDRLALTLAIVVAPPTWGQERGLGEALEEHVRQDQPAEWAGRHLAAGRYGAALEAAGQVAPPGLRAEGSFHVLRTGGDLPGALHAAEEGLAVAPDNSRLLENAALTALALGLGREAALHARVLVGLTGLDEATRERARALLADAEELERLEERGRRGVKRARTAAGLLIGAAVLGLITLARRSAS